MIVSRRDLIRGAVTTALVATHQSSLSNTVQTSEFVTPEMFGAKGDGKTNDTAAFAAMSEHVNARGGGNVVLRKTTYIVGMQVQSNGDGSDYAFAPAKIMEFSGCSRPLIVQGNGARLKCADGLRFGTFDPNTGRATRRKLPNYAPGELSSPYHWMIKVENCSGTIDIADLELDGNLEGLNVGGPWGDTGYQIGACGLGLINNDGLEAIRHVYSHHHAMDGILINGADHDRKVVSLFTLVRSEYNVRQGCSIVGGRGYRFEKCRFNHTGKAGLASGPGGGVDVEAERKKVRNLAFINCEFSNNHGPGLVADQGDSEGAIFRGCTFIGTTSWSAWPCMPRFRFESCRFVGPIVNAFGDAQQPARATQFLDCTFLDDPALSPTRQVYKPPRTDGPIADLSNNPNVRFRRCSFIVRHAHTLPWTTSKVIFEDCQMIQLSPNPSYPRGTYVGSNVISGNVDLYSAVVKGRLVVNGKLQSLTR